MAKTEVGVKVKVDTGEAQESVGKLNEDLKKTGQAATKAGDAAKKGAGMFSALGNAVKALGIVTVIAGAFNFFREALGKNQKVADTLAAVFGTVASVLNQLINIVINVTTEVGKNTNGFNALGKVLSGILTLVITPFKAAFLGIKLVVQELQLAWEDSFLGDKDQTKIKELTKNINETKDSLKQTGENAINAGKDIVTNFIDAASSIGDVVSGTIDGVKKINIGATFEQQKAIVSLKNNAEIAAAVLGGLIEKYDRLAEQQRQIRDDETKSIDDRIKANNELGKILELQRKAQLQQAQQILKSAQAEANADKTNIQLQKAVIEAKNNVAAVEAQITGLLSEQKVNAVGLAKIKIELGKQEAQALNQRLLNEQKATAELIKNENDKLAAKKKIFEEESKLEIARLEANVKATNAGTEARVAAEIELANKKSELAIQGQALDQQILETGLNKQLEQINKQKEIFQSDFQMKADLLNQEAALIEEQYKKRLITDQQYFDAKRNIVIQQNQLEIEALNRIFDLVNQTSESINSIFTSDFSYRQNVLSQEGSMLDMRLKKQTQTLDSQLEQNLISDKKYQDSKKKLDKEYQAAKEEVLQKEMDLQAKKVRFEQSMLIIKQIIAAKELMLEIKKNIFFGKSTLARGIASTAEGAAQTSKIGFPQNIPMLIAYGVQAAGIIMSIRQAVKTMGAAGDLASFNASGGGAGITSTAPVAPTLAPQVVATQVNTAAVNQMGNRAARAYVLNSDIQNDNQRNAYIDRNASIG